MSRSYRLLCPIARSLDRVGDRWTLLILRDLHAGPMRYGDVLTGLPGIASNLLATRLQKLQSDGLVEQTQQLYSLTELGKRTERVLWELAILGGQFPPEEDIKQPGHLRLVAVTLRGALRRVVPKDLEILVDFILDGESLTIDISPSRGVDVHYGAPDNADLIAESSYEPMMAVASGDLPMETFRAAHVKLQGPAAKQQSFATLMGRVLTEGFVADELFTR
ncbi:MAG: winged helix-turn-helix transcriptional regulator [Nannocystaceae bacterium]|nr:winged helix-turn-helix transcriptional regulator [Nannocystaceae bacterium]